MSFTDYGLSYTDNSKTDIGTYRAKVIGLGNDNYTLDGVTNISQDWSIVGKPQEKSESKSETTESDNKGNVKKPIQPLEFVKQDVSKEEKQDSNILRIENDDKQNIENKTILPDSENDSSQNSDTNHTTDNSTINYEDTFDRFTDKSIDVIYGEGIIQIQMEYSDQENTKEQADVVNQETPIGISVSNLNNLLCAAMTEEELINVSKGEKVNIRLVVTKLENSVPQNDKEAINDLLKETKDNSNLLLGSYIDISLEKKIGNAKWKRLSKTNEELEVTLDLPKELQIENAKYYIARSHEEKIDILEDLDTNDNTVTIRTDLFSTYAILYTHTDALQKTNSFPWYWLAILGIAVAVGIFTILRNPRFHKGKNIS